jgi:outer membrane lipoprotein
MKSAAFVKGFILVLLGMIAGCTAGISEQARSQVTFWGTFPELQAEPERHQGEVVLLGGRIIETLVAEASSEIIVLQLPLNRNNQPLNNDQSQGRFVVRSSQFLDPAVYTKGILLTVVGRVVSSEKRPIGEMDYLYPVLEPIEIKKWSLEDLESPRIHFGIGVGTHF